MVLNLRCPQASSIFEAWADDRKWIWTESWMIDYRWIKYLFKTYFSQNFVKTLIWYEFKVSFLTRQEKHWKVTLSPSFNVKSQKFIKDFRTWTHSREQETFDKLHRQWDESVEILLGENRKREKCEALCCSEQNCKPTDDKSLPNSSFSLTNSLKI